jgi:hypothetical protein
VAPGRGEHRRLPTQPAQEKQLRFIHVAVDNHSRVAYAEVHPDEKAAIAGQHPADRDPLVPPAAPRPAQRSCTARRGKVYRRSHDWAAVCQALQISRRFIKPGCPWTNGKDGRFNRTLLTDWACAGRGPATASAPPPWNALLDRYNTRR